MSEKKRYVKSRSTIRKAMNELREFIDSGGVDPAERRMAYLAECILQWATERTVGWDLVQKAKLNARLLKSEVTR